MAEDAHLQSSAGDRSWEHDQRTKSHNSRFTVTLSRARSSPSTSDGKVGPAEEPVRQYGSARLSGSANAVLGDVHNYNYYQSADAKTALVHHDSGLEVGIDTISDYDARREEWLRSQPRIPETCQWIFRVPEYRRWYSGDGPPILICLGSVGCGKSTTAGAVVDSLHQDQSQRDRGVITFFVNTSPNHENTAMGLVRALIKQLVAHYRETERELHSDTQTALKEAFRYPKSLQDIGILTRLLELLITGSGGYTFVIDGVDYLQEQEIVSYLKVVRDIFKKQAGPRSNSKFIMFCRETLGRGIRPESLASSITVRIGLAHLKHDIYRYVDYLIAAKQLDREITTDDALLDEIKRVLKANSAKITNVTAPFFQTVLDRVLPHRIRKPSTKRLDRSVLLPVPSMAFRQGLMGESLGMHDYLCRHWLSHNRQITTTREAFTLFAGLCLAHDPDLQPWATGTTSGLDHYRRLVDFAIMNEHVPLLRLTVDHLQQEKPTFCRRAFLGLCPGTDSSFLHIAAALGNSEIVDILLEVRRKDFADGLGRSPAALAISCHQSHLFERLLPRLEASFEGGLWCLTNVMDEQMWENTLQVCVANDEQTCLMIIVTNYLTGLPDSNHQDVNESWRKVLSAVFFQACRLAEDDCARFVAGLDLVDPNIFFELQVPRASSRSHRRRSSVKCYSTLSKALELGDIRLMQNLLRLGADPRARGDHPNMADIIKRFGSRFDRAGPFIEVLVCHGWPSKYGDGFPVASWLEELVCLEPPSTWPSLRFRRANQYLRSILRVLSHVADDDQLRALRQHYRPNSRANVLFGEWLKVVPDDVLVPILKYNWLHHDYLISVEMLNIMAMRGTSRCLETWMSSETWMRLESATGSLGLVDRLAAIGVKLHGPPTPEGFGQRRQGSLQVHPEGCTRQTELWHSREQRVEFLVWYSAQARAVLLPDADAATGRYKFLIEALDSHGRCAVDKTDTLPWVRLYIATRGDRYRTNELYHQLAQAKSDANPGLNFPAGYTKFEEDLGETWVISRSVIRCIYRWNFRLNRKRGKSCSEADTMYMAMVWMEFIEAMCPQGPPIPSFASSSQYALYLLGKVQPLSFS